MYAINGYTVAVEAKHLETGNGLSYMILQSKPASTRVCRGCHRGVHSGHHGWVGVEGESFHSLSRLVHSNSSSISKSALA
jgi:hypothetical protein